MPNHPDQVEIRMTTKVGKVALIIPVLALILSGSLMTLEVRLGLVGAAVILGWTQLVGL
jgi:hypothetical protein